MKRFLVMMAFALAAGWLEADPRPFQVGIGAGVGYYSLANDVESDLSGTLLDQRSNYSFWGGNAFLDLSDYVTVSAGVWSGAGNARETLDAIDFDETAANTLVLLDLGAVVKAPISFGEAWTLSPKLGINDVLYLSGAVGGATPDTAGKQELSPFSLVVGADTDYVFPNGVFLRVPLDLDFALNSRPTSVNGSYVGSNTIGFKVGISIGYKLLGHEADASAAQAPAATPAPAPESKPEDSAAAPSKLPVSISFGGGTSYAGFTNDQKATSSGVPLEIKQVFSSWGLNAFADITPYVTVSAGLRAGLGNDTLSETDSPDETAANNVRSFEFGAEVKYPFAFGGPFSFAPKVGIDDIVYAFGGLGSSSLSSDGKLALSPLSILLGVDLNYELENQMFVRVPLDFGFALNSKLSSAFYSGVTYDSSSVLSFRAGIEIGHHL